ncbi:MogA/MoaB family molybdenum cofactor biosynthesis protein [Salinibaculum salinum]|uniref:MogA/MoaB family molybdenum cofactor biosynthesis protein n=1 Tax=Salinibaculum salinum TaxID=3131996 RepID=UPI0030EC3B16
MVDFQSRDTSRGYGNDEGTEDSDEEDTEESDPAEGTVEDEMTDFDEYSIPYAVVTFSNGQTMEMDSTGKAVVDAIEHAGDAVSTRELVGPDYDSIQSTVSTLARREDVTAIVTVGGTGVSPDDETVEAVEPLFDKELPGFGELYRVLSHDLDGTAVIRTRTTAGIVDGVPVFCLPKDTAGARRGVEQIVLEEAETLAEQASGE